MTLNELIKLASSGYPDGLVEQCWDAAGGHVIRGAVGDTLAEFIATELQSTYDATASDAEQLREVAGAMYRAACELHSVRATFEDRLHEVDSLAPLENL